MKNNNYGNKYGNILTMILIVVIVIILGIAGYFAYSVHDQTTKNDAAQTAMADFEQATKTVRKKVKDNIANENSNENIEENVTEVVTPNITTEPEGNSSTEEETKKVMYEGYEMKGTINIPKTGCNYPVLAEVTKHSLEVAVAILYGPGLNEPGNTVIVGHNYRN